MPYIRRGLKAPGSNNSPYAGYDVAFSPDHLKVLYQTHQDYVDKVTADVRSLVTRRWLTPADGDEMIGQARGANVPGP